MYLYVTCMYPYTCMLPVCYQSTVFVYMYLCIRVLYIFCCVLAETHKL